MVHAEKLTYQVSDQALSSLSKFSQAHQSKHLVTHGQTIVQKPGALDCIFQVSCPRLLEVSGVISLCKLTTTAWLCVVYYISHYRFPKAMDNHMCFCAAVCHFVNTIMVLLTVIGKLYRHDHWWFYQKDMLTSYIYTFQFGMCKSPDSPSAMVSRLGYIAMSCKHSSFDGDAFFSFSNNSPIIVIIPHWLPMPLFEVCVHSSVSDDLLSI